MRTVETRGQPLACLRTPLDASSQFFLFGVNDDDPNPNDDDDD